MASIVIDTGTARGGAHAEWIRELGRRIASELGDDAVLASPDSRALDDRAAHARRIGARVFVALHARPGDGGETYVHDRAGGASHELARAIQARLGPAAGTGALMPSELAVLAPDRLPPCAACLIDAGTAGKGLERATRAVVDGVRAWTGGGTSTPQPPGAAERYGRRDARPAQPRAKSAAAASCPAARVRARAAEYPAATRFAAASASAVRPWTEARPRPVKRVVVHITSASGDLDSQIRADQAPDAAGAAHYVVGRDGEVVQMVRHDDVAVHSGASDDDSIAIFIVARPAGVFYDGDPGLPTTPPQYASLAQLVGWLCAKLGFPFDRSHVVGHRELDPDGAPDCCPDGAFDWDALMPSQARGGSGARVPDLRQAGENTCWATAYTMMASWRQGRTLAVDEALRAVGDEWARLAREDRVLPWADVERFATAAGLHALPGLDYPIDRWQAFLEQLGPIWISLAPDPGDTEGPMDSVVITAVRRDSDGDGDGGTIELSDPETGTRSLLPFDELSRRFRERVVAAGIPYPQVFHWPPAD